MVGDTEGIVLRQTKAAYGRRMLLIFTRKYGKISVGTSIAEGGKSKSALAIRPFTYGRYEIFKGRDSYSLNNAQVVRSYYGLGEDIDKYMAASYVLELTEKVLTEELPQPAIFRLLLEFLETLEARKSKHDTLVLAYIVKLVGILGAAPVLDRCACCGGELDGNYFSVAEGGMICPSCYQNFTKNPQTTANEALIYQTNFGIVDILKYFQKEPLSAFEKIALDDGISQKLGAIMRSYLAYHFDIHKLKSESFFAPNIEGES